MIEPNYLPFILIGGGIIFVVLFLSLIHISEPTRLQLISYAVFGYSGNGRGVNNLRVH